MSQAFAVRPIQETDYAQWKILWDGYNAFYGRKDATALPLAITQTTWSRFFDAAEPVHALVAMEADRMLGLVHYIFHRSTIFEAATCYLQDLFTIQEARGAGIGRALIEAVYEKARAAGTRRVYWNTHETNATAMILYDKLATRSGFVQYAKLVS